jgi:membrane protein DedA with SNARE-associated domain
MNVVLQFVTMHGYAILFGALFAHQIGLPLPGPLFLLAAGALAAVRRLGLPSAVILATAACVSADWIWYEAGRRRGDRVLHFLHSFTREPEVHNRRAKRTFARFGPSLLLIAKFVPGLDAVSPPLCGTSGVSRARFLSFDAMGAGLYASLYASLGFVFSRDLNRVATYVGRTGKVLVGAMFAATLLYVIVKLVRSRREQQGPPLVQITAPVPLEGVSSEL